MTARTQKLERHALASQEFIGGLWTLTCTCKKQFAEPVNDDAGKRFWAHQDTFAPGRWDSPSHPALGRETECVICGTAMWTFSDSDVFCRRCADEL